jgi:hypothetical protein
MRVRVALGAGLTLMAIAIGITLTRSPPTLAWSDYTPLNGTFTQLAGGTRACQAHMNLPMGASGVRLSLYAGLGPRVTVKILSGDRVLTSGVRDAGWRGESPTVPLQPVSRGVPGVKLCFALGRTTEAVAIDGVSPSPEAATFENGQSVGGKMRVEYLQAGHRSWLSLASSVARRAGLGRWAAGTWIVLLALTVMTAIVVGASWLVVKELG